MVDRDEMPAGYADTLPDVWKNDAASHWRYVGSLEASQTRDDFALTAFLRRILPDVALRPDLDDLDRRHIARLADYLTDHSTRGALNDRLTELMSLTRYASDYNDPAAPDHKALARLLAMLEAGVEAQVDRIDFRARRDQPKKPSN